MAANGNYRWLDQQGEAFGSPGLEPRWTSSIKDAVGTAYAASSRIWFTVSHGILNEVYHPTIDRPQVRDMELLVTDGESFVHEEKRDLEVSFEYIYPGALGVRYINSDPLGRYRIVKEIISDPHHSVVLMQVRLEAGPKGNAELLSRLKVYLLVAPHLDGGGAGNSARVLDIAGRKMALAWKGDWSLALGANCGFTRLSCGFVGASDGWRDLTENFEMNWEFGSATNGNIAIMGELDLSRPDLTRNEQSGSASSQRGVRECVVAIGIGQGHHTALQKTVSTLSVPFSEHHDRFIAQWKRAESPESLVRATTDGGQLMRTSHAVLLAHEDKTYSGAFVASASIPWGMAKSDDDLGGYHLVWTRDMVQTASALLACGREETARRALVYLACTQQPDGGFAQNFWVNGEPYWHGSQLDEVAFPVILAWRLWKADALGQMEIVPFVERAAGYLARHAPITQQERWEENSGYSPSTLAAVISALVCAAEILKSHESVELARFYEEFADWIESHLEDWTVTNNGVLLEGVKRHYMRIRPPESGEAYACEDCGTEHLRLSNRPPGTRYEFEAREIIDGGFLELVRYGVRRADDPLIVDSLKVVDAVLKRELPQGPCWLRYNWDGYGQREDGGPFTGYGQGRPWPLLTGERAHYELAAGNDVRDLIRTYERFASIGGMLPEQVWDEPDHPTRTYLRFGTGAGSAQPLVWAHAEYLKLLRSAADGHVFDRIDAVYARYAQRLGELHAPLEIFSQRRPIQHLPKGATLRVLDPGYFELIWSADGWKTRNVTASTIVGSAGHRVDLTAEMLLEAAERKAVTSASNSGTSATGDNLSSGVASGGELETSFPVSVTFHWPENDHWLGFNYEISAKA